MISFNIRSSDKPRISPPSDHKLGVEYSKTHQAITILIYQVPQTETWWQEVVCGQPRSAALTLYQSDPEHKARQTHILRARSQEGSKVRRNDVFGYKLARRRRRRGPTSPHPHNGAASDELGALIETGGHLSFLQ